jgi:hypothetical protein
MVIPICAELAGGSDGTTWSRKEAEKYGRGSPAGGSQYVETMAHGTC